VETLRGEWPHMRKLLIPIPSPQHWRLIINLGCPNDRSKYYPRCSREYSILGERDYMISWSWNVLKESIPKPYQNIEDNWAVFKHFNAHSRPFVMVGQLDSPPHGTGKWGNQLETMRFLWGKRRKAMERIINQPSFINHIPIHWRLKSLYGKRWFNAH